MSVNQTRRMGGIPEGVADNLAAGELHDAQTLAFKLFGNELNSCGCHAIVIRKTVPATAGFQIVFMGNAQSDEFWISVVRRFRASGNRPDRNRTRNGVASSADARVAWRCLGGRILDRRT